MFFADHKKEILLIDKPKGMTSFFVVHLLRKKLGIKKMGHAGTLDPMATGLLIVGFGLGTKKLKDFIKLPKVYLAHIKLGVKTDTGDITGRVIKETGLDGITEDKVREVLCNLVGEISLSVPAYSAIKKDGRALYSYAYKNETVEIPQKKMVIYDITFLSFKDGIVCARFNVSSGTYIRSIAEEIGVRLCTVATLCDLRRLSIGNYSVEDAEKMPDKPIKI